MDSNPVQCLWDFRWAKWQGDKFFNKYFGFSLSLPSHLCSASIFIQLFIGSI